MKFLYRRFLLFGLTAVTGLSVFSQQAYFPGKEWQRKKPTEVNMKSAPVDSAVQFALHNDSRTDYDLRIAITKSFGREPGFEILGPTRPRDKPSGLIIKNGYIVAEWGDLNRVNMTFSVTKSYLSTVAGLAVNAGLIRNVDDKLESYVWDGTFDGVHNAKITWRHLLTQSSDWSGTLFGVHDWADRPPAQGGIDDWKNRALHEPGTFFKYNDVRVNLLAYSLLQVWRRPLPVVLKERIMDPIGASSTWRWYGYENSFVNIDGLRIQSVSGGGHLGGGLFINTLDQARFGLLFLRKGKWKEQQLVSEDWIREARKPSAANKNYGFMWWLNEEKALGAVSSRIYYASGFGGNYIVIDDEHDLLIVVRWLEPGRLGEFVRMVSRAIED